jgi:hypothetical protein
MIKLRTPLRPVDNAVGGDMAGHISPNRPSRDER